jgi:site-specific recombinase XerD
MSENAKPSAGGTPVLGLLKEFVEVHMPVARGLSPNTVTSYKACFRLLFEFMESKRGIGASDVRFADLDQEALADFLDWIEGDRGCSALTRNQRLAALRAFSEFAQNRDFDAAACFRRAALKVPMKKAVGKERAFFTTEEVKILLALPRASTKTGLRDKVLLSVMHASGARAQEICDLTVGDLRDDGDRIALRIVGKGCKARQVRIGTQPSSMLRRYVRHRGIDNQPESHVFSSQTHEKMTVSCVEGIFKKYVRTAKAQFPTLFRSDSYPPHSMRHTTATGMIEAGVRLPVIKSFLGHSRLATTEIYATMTQESVDDEVAKWSESFWGHCKEDDREQSGPTPPDFLL